MSNVTNKLSSINSVEDYVVRQKIFYSTFPSPHLWMMPSPRSCATTTITSSFGKRNVLTVSIHVVDCYTKSSVPMEINWIRYRLLTNAQQQYRGVNSYVSSLAALTISSALAKKRGPSKHHIMWMGLTFSANRKTPKSSCSRGYASGPQESKIMSRAQSTDFLDNKLHASDHSSVWLYHSENKSFVGFWGYFVLYWYRVCTNTQHSKQQNKSPDSSWSDRRSNTLFWCNHRYNNSLEAPNRRPPGRNHF